MSDDISSLYQEVIIEHARSPRNFREIQGATHTVEVVNPLCGDQLTLYLQVADDTVTDIAFKGTGCAISQASASLMTMAVKDLPQEEALALFDRVHTMLTTESHGDTPPADVGKLAALAGVWQYPMRVKCATLAWQALRSTLESSASENGALESSAIEDTSHQDATE